MPDLEPEETTIMCASTSTLHTLESLSEILRSVLPRLQREYGVTLLEMFGSYVRGEAKPESDLDLLVEFSLPPTLFEFVSLEDELSGLLGIPVDLVMKDGLKPAIGERVRQEAVAV